MPSEAILLKYLRQLRRCGADNVSGGYRHLDAVELAFRLAIEELEAGFAPADTVAQLGTANLRIMELQADLERLQTATNAEVADLRQQLAQLDADNAALIRRNKELADELDIATGVAPATAKPVAIHNTDHPNGTAQSPISNLQSSMWHGFDMLAKLDDEAADWWIGCDTGRHQWRTVPKPIQLRMVRHVLSFRPDTGDMTMREFDAIKPDWMPTSTSHTQTLKLSWQQLNNFLVELEATR